MTSTGSIVPTMTPMQLWRIYGLCCFHIPQMRITISAFMQMHPKLSIAMIHLWHRVPAFCWVVRRWRNWCAMDWMMSQNVSRAIMFLMIKSYPIVWPIWAFPLRIPVIDWDGIDLWRCNQIEFLCPCNWQRQTAIGSIIGHNIHSNRWKFRNSLKNFSLNIFKNVA